MRSENEMKKTRVLAGELRKQLHMMPERSMKEIRTKEYLMRFLREETELEVIDRGLWFYARRISPEAEGAIGFRADFDAVTDRDGISRHLCGHDGHAAILAAFGKWITEHQPKKNVFLIFQPGEESGQGAKLCCDILKDEKIDEIYAFHNIPGQPQGEILLRRGTFACASTGLEISFRGRTTHAAYPENGLNPTGAIAGLIMDVEAYAARPHEGIVLSTVIGIEAGSASYGVAASEGTLRLTVRAEYFREFTAFLDYIGSRLDELRLQGLEIDLRRIETFPSTENTGREVERLRACAEKNHLQVTELPVPMRWSEDFGWYLQKLPGAMFGVGAGENWPPLHTEHYEFNDEITETVLTMYRELLI